MLQQSVPLGNPNHNQISRAELERARTQVKNRCT